jgi:hypothetical protein
MKFFILFTNSVFILFCFIYVSFLCFFSYFVLFRRLTTPDIRLPRFQSLPPSLMWKQTEMRGGARVNMATPTERHGGLQRDRKSIPGSRYDSGSHHDCDSAPFRISGWNSFEYWSKEQVLQLLSPFELTGASVLNVRTALTCVSLFYSVFPGLFLQN